MSEDSNPYEGSPYDASGMPLATETADYDNYAEVAQKMVKDKVITYPENINQAEGYVEATLETESDVTKKGYNSAIEDNVNTAYPTEFAVEDMSDTGESRKLSVVEKDGFTETIDTPKMGNSAFLEQGREDSHDFLAALEAPIDTPQPDQQSDQQWHEGENQ